MNDRDLPADLESSWNANAEAWVAAVRTGAIASRRLATDAAVMDAVLARRPRRVLDLGCGEGWLARALTAHGIESVGVDGSPALIDAARAAGGGAFHVCSYADFATGTQRIGTDFELVVANFALLHAEIAPLLRAVRRVLAPGGTLVIQTIHPWSVGGAYIDGWREEDFDNFEGAWRTMPWYFRTLESWVAVLCGCGYAITDLREPRHPDTRARFSLLIAAEHNELPPASG